MRDGTAWGGLDEAMIKALAMLCGLGPPGERWIGLLKCWFCGNLLMSCRFLVIFLVVSRNMCNFAAKLN